MRREKGQGDTQTGKDRVVAHGQVLRQGQAKSTVTVEYTAFHL